MASSVAVAAVPVQFHDYLLYPIDNEKPPIPDLSKYRALHEKSISSVSQRTLEVYTSSPPEKSHLADGDCYPRLDSPTLSTKVIRRRSKSVTSLLTLRRERRRILSPPLPTSPPPVSVSVGTRGAEFFKGLAESLTGVIGSLSPRIAVGAVDTDNGRTRHRQSSLSSGPSVVRSPVPSALVSPYAQSFARASSNLNLAPDSQTAPSPAVPSGPSVPSTPLASPSYVLLPKTTNIPPLSLSSLASKPLPLRSPTLNHDYIQNFAHPTGRDRSVSRSPPSRSRSRPRGLDSFKHHPSTSIFDLPAPESPILRTVPSASDIARFKHRNLLALRINTEAAESAAKLEREELERQEQEAERVADEVARLEAENDRIAAEQKKRDPARLYAPPPTPSPRFPRLFVLDKLPFLYLTRRSNAVASQPSTPSPGAPTISSLDFSRPNSPEDSSSPEKMSFIAQGGKGIVPGTDAPASAINGGERRVCVRCLSSVINLPVNADTSPVDIIYSTANLTSHDVDPKASILIECYVELGLERRLRRYERIRDVMNSWDRDQQNSLLVVTNDISQSDDPDLDIKSVPRTPTPPPGFSLQMYHSSRPGKWNKRWITLLESGQMYASKKPDSKASDKDSTVLCHLSDFDIYTPRESEARRHLKAPRRFCYAVKSQQKTFVFPNGENFVHFFCAEDGQLARRFLELVQRWRSWYLVNKQVDFEKKDKKDKAPQISMGFGNGTSPKAMSRSKSTAAKGHSTQVSVDETPYTIGAFQPLLDMDRFDKPLEEFGKDLEQDKNKNEPDSDPEFKTGLVRKATCKQSNVLSKSKSVHNKRRSPPVDEKQFSSTGLLGQGYEEKRKIAERAPVVSPTNTNSAFTKGASLLGQGYEQKRKVHEKTPVDNSYISTNAAFTEGPSLLNGGVLSPTTPKESSTDSKSWFPIGTDQSARPSYRSKSLRDTNRRPMTEKVPDIPQPLVNLTNSFPEPPRWREKNKGHGVKAPTGGPLISLATGGQSNNMFNTRSTSGLINQPRIPSSSSTMNMGSRPRSRSTAGMQPPPSHAPPVPPVPIRSLRREMTAPIDQSRGRDPRPRGPLIDRAGTVGQPSRI
ncbi:hypothetical protein FPOAC2_10807 [Fusarium poae]|uniref:hypothetical protein n=1 Tax=Fusarium poae TaxID=36050 RepID=UPI001CE71FEC|nr:hypothetical protein FPOAC1_010525 [Fusarium poae]KAG8665724.1 hypothetical protein FPOAC1_010525 [Fusarium poae]